MRLDRQNGFSFRTLLATSSAKLLLGSILGSRVAESLAYGPTKSVDVQQIVLTRC